MWRQPSDADKHHEKIALLSNTVVANSSTRNRGDATGDAVGSYTCLVHNILQNRFKFLKGDALPDTHVGVTINYFDMRRHVAGDEACGLPEVR